MSKAILSALALTACLACTSVARSESSDEYEFVLVLQTQSVARVGLENGSNLFPWDSPTTLVNGEILEIVSNNCGFADYEYAAATLADYQQLAGDDRRSRRIAARATTGEWCRISNHLYEYETLIVTRMWAGRRYIVAHTDVFRDSPDRRYITEPHFISEWMLDEFVQPIPDPDSQNSCYAVEDLPLDYELQLEAEGYERFDDLYCATRGVFLGDIPIRVRPARFLRLEE